MCGDLNKGFNQKLLKERSLWCLMFWESQKLWGFLFGFIWFLYQTGLAQNLTICLYIVSFQR